MINLSNNKLSKNQKGLASLIVTVVIMVVLSITVISFATLMRREQRQTLDRQLNTQAFYAAESGINDTVAKLNSLSPTDPLFQTSYTDCTGPNSFTAKAGLSPDLEDPISYSCLLVDPAPKSLEFGNIDEAPHVIPVVPLLPPAPTPPIKIQNITISWQAKDSDTNVNCPGIGSAPELVTRANWTCKTGLLRVDLVPVDTVTRDALNNKLRTLFMYPSPGPYPATQTISALPGSSQTGILVQANCQVPLAPGAPKYCGVKVDVSSFNSEKYYLRVSSLYVASAVTIAADDGSVPVSLTGAQAVIDSTGKANDVLRRIQVRVSLNPLGKGPFPNAALQSAESICKRLAVIPTASPPVTSDPSGPDPTGACSIN